MTKTFSMVDIFINKVNLQDLLQLQIHKQVGHGIMLPESKLNGITPDILEILPSIFIR